MQIYLRSPCWSLNFMYVTTLLAKVLRGNLPYSYSCNMQADAYC
jgi:hypothetical protein